jgi:hypothetical protein
VTTSGSQKLPFSPWPTAAVQLHQTGHSSIAQYFGRVKVGDGGPCCRSLRLRQWRLCMMMTETCSDNGQLIAVMAISAHLHPACGSTSLSTTLEMAKQV